MMLAQHCTRVSSSVPKARRAHHYMRTDSTRISIWRARTDRARHRSLWRGLHPRDRAQVQGRQGRQDAHEAIRASPWSGPGERQALPDPGQFALYDLVWRRYVASQHVERRATRRHRRHRRRGRRASAPTARSSSSTATCGSIRTCARRKTAKGACRRCRRPDRRLLQLLPRQHFHRAAAALHRSEPHQGARGARHRPAEHLRDDRQHDPGARVRAQGCRPLRADALGVEVGRRSRRASRTSSRPISHGPHGDRARQGGNGEDSWRDVVGSFYKPFSRDLVRRSPAIRSRCCCSNHTTESSARSAAAR
jgi:hypothetical protein